MNNLPPAVSTLKRPPLTRTPRGFPDRPAPLIAGVCSGLAVHSGVSATAVRVAMVLAVVFAGAGIFLYLWLWVTVTPTSQTRTYRVDRLAASLRQPLVESGSSNSWQIGLMAATGFFAIAFFAFGLTSGYWSIPTITVAVVLMVSGIALVWTQTPRLDNWRAPIVLGTTALGVALVFIGGILALLISGEPLGSVGLAFGSAIVLILALAVAFYPAWQNLERKLQQTRIAQARETERADIAAHLHDSVLQTLTLIKSHAGNPATVRSLALTQERELRAWLYTGTTDPGHSITELLRQAAGDVEKHLGQEVELVCVGECEPGTNELAASAAAAEAMTNAARHGAAPIRVYAEVSDQLLDIFVTDRGAGFDPKTIRPDRHGVRDSIIGRVERVGGAATIRRLKPGTEVHISVPRTEVK